MIFFKTQTSHIAVLKIAAADFEAMLTKNNISFKEIAPHTANVHSIYEYKYSKYNDTIVLYAVKDAYESILIKN